MTPGPIGKPYGEAGRAEGQGLQGQEAAWKRRQAVIAAPRRPISSRDGPDGLSESDLVQMMVRSQMRGRDLANTSGWPLPVWHRLWQEARSRTQKPWEVRGWPGMKR